MSLIRAFRRLGLSNRSWVRMYSNGEEINNTPIKFTTSGAAKWRAENTRKGPDNKRLWFEPHVILASLSVFMVYFCYLREENDLDKELQRTLYSRIEGLEEHQLKVSLEYGEGRGEDTSKLRQRLDELQQQQQETE
ncbi:PREDICTED: uncharacterized protein LOC108569340 [Nicrophorus vespilloides]|uniref:Uncharacterized protein LOC108569340 n=1 Tax=Nicrophorus vespilloides TaxID=110193 RepID=A0ABM1NHP1_NICVS|nr:PREDICTED: uncharacterized protein LOC108569340 [Nicrophorus vespilloides]